MTTGRSRDRISLTGIRAKGFHGVFPEERRQGQEFLVDVVLELDLATPGRSDDLADTVDYGRVAGTVVAKVSGPAYDLIERLATSIADELLEDERLGAVEVTVHKPQAPIPHVFGDVAVTIRREGGAHVVIALGANLGDREGSLRSAVRELGSVEGVDVTAVSALFETAPVGPEQPDYVNAVVLARACIGPSQLLGELHRIEAQHGRVRETHWGARTLDLDLIQYGRPGGPREALSEESRLALPHPRAHERAFVLAPWAVVDGLALARVGCTPESPIVPVADLLREAGLAGIRLGPTWRPRWWGAT